MGTKKIAAIIVFCLILATIAMLYFSLDKNSQNNDPKKDFSPQKENIIHKQKTLEKKVIEKKYDLYNTTPYDLPLVSIVEISKLSPEIKTIVDELLDTAQGLYYLKATEDRIFAILQNPVTSSNVYHRHDLQFVEILPNGKTVFHNAGYSGIDGETFAQENTKQDVWVFDKTLDIPRPIKHIAYNENKKLKYTEYWNYDDSLPIKYEMKDENKKTISILKESQDNDSNYRKEHVFYDNNGKITMSLTINYEGANISRLMFFNSHDTIDSVNIISEYSNNYKTCEKIYNEDFVLSQTIKADYSDGERKTLRVFNDAGEEVKKLSS